MNTKIPHTNIEKAIVIFVSVWYNYFVSTVQFTMVQINLKNRVVHLLCTPQTEKSIRKDAFFSEIRLRRVKYAVACEIASQ